MITDISTIKETTIDGYTVSKQLRQVQMIELDMLKHLLLICKENNLRVWAYGGTLLGAVRHRGFIPWDDDIDVVMPREDYDKLNALSEDLWQPYFFQTTYKDKNHIRGHAQLRNSQTTALLEVEYRLKINHGIFIDIFPLDGVPSEINEQSEAKKKAEHLLYLMRTNRPFRIPVTWNPLKIFRYSKNWLQVHRYFKRNGLTNFDCYREYEDIFRQTPFETAKQVGTLSLIYGFYKDKHIYDETTLLDFEGIKIPAPKQYDKMLRIMYGDNYMTPVHSTTSHGVVILNPEIPYCQVQKELIQNRSWMKDFFREIRKRMK